jgi:hypothetical protein
MGEGLRDLCRRKKITDHFWVTECGWTTFAGKYRFAKFAGGYPRSSFVQQAYYLVRMCIAGRSSGLEKIYIHRFENTGNDPGYTEHNFGMMFHNFSPKPSYMAIAYMAARIGQLQYKRDFSPSLEMVRLAHFSGPEEDTIVAYAIEKEKTVRIPIVGVPEVRDLMGNKIPSKVQGKELVVKLTESPVYISGADIPALTNTVRIYPLKISAATFGESLEIPLQVVNGTGTDAEKGRIFVTMSWENLYESRSFDIGTMKNGETKTFNLKFPISSKWISAIGNRLDLLVSAEMNGKKNFIQKHLDLLTPLEVAITDRMEHRGIPAVGIKLNSNCTHTVNAEILFKNKKYNTICPAGKSTMLWLPVGKERIFPVTISCGSWSKSFKKVIRNHIVNRLPEKPVLKGNSSLLKKMVTMECGSAKDNYYSCSSLEKRKGDADLFAKACLGYDSKNLYIAVKVRDDVFFQPDSNQGQYWNGDSIQMALAAPSDNTDYMRFGVSRSED